MEGALNCTGTRFSERMIVWGREKHRSGGDPLKPGLHGRPVPAEERDERLPVPVFVLPPGTEVVDVDVEILERQDAPSSPGVDVEVEPAS